jgi:nitroimidazol reductase NimA-like FMN-containing flavoprotein (pyridoxamine 5'-phosphate oxidase superfamily)
MAPLDLSLTREELDRFLSEQRTIRLATASLEGRPHVVPLWYVWVDGTVFMNSTLGNVTIRNLERNPRATGSVDDGHAYDELRGVLVYGVVERADDDPRLDTVMHRWSEKYMGGNPLPYARWRNRAWFRLAPTTITSWDFRKIPAAKERAQAQESGAG